MRDLTLIYKDLDITIQTPFFFEPPYVVINQSSFPLETLSSTLRRTSDSLPFSVRPHPSQIKIDQKVRENRFSLKFDYGGREEL